MVRNDHRVQRTICNPNEIRFRLEQSTKIKLPKLVSDGVLKITDRSLKEFRENCLKSELRDKTEEMVKHMVNAINKNEKTRSFHYELTYIFLQKLICDWELKMVLSRKLDPLLTNAHVLQHPVIIQRKYLEYRTKIEKDKVKKKTEIS